MKINKKTSIELPAFSAMRNLGRNSTHTKKEKVILLGMAFFAQKQNRYKSTSAKYIK
jgi:hypothetical protein